MTDPGVVEAPRELFSSSRLIVREWQPDDGNAAFAIYGDPEVVRYVGSGCPDPDPEFTRRAVMKTTHRFRAEASGLGFWAVAERDGGAVVGAVLLMPIDGGPDTELGIHLARAYWGRGYGTEVGRAALSYALRQLGLRRVVAAVYPENAGSQALMRKLGMEFEEQRDEGGLVLDYFVARLRDAEV